MAAKNKNSRAQKAVSEKKKSQESKQSKGKSSVSKNTSEALIPANIMIGVFSLILFILFVVAAINPEGVLLEFVESVMLGLLGQAGFYMAIPALFYLFVIQIFKRKSAVKMRSICLGCFVILAGAFSHVLLTLNVTVPGGAEMITYLFQGGSLGKTGGVIAGAFAELIKWICGNTIAVILLLIACVLTLLGSMQLTIPRIAKAIKERPRPDWEDEEEEIPFKEPAAVVVERIANRKIEQQRKRRQQLEMAENEYPEEDMVPVAVPASKKKQDMINQIDTIAEPVAAAAEHVTEEPPVPTDAPVYPATAKEEESIPAQMPPYRPEEQAKPASKVEVKVKSKTDMKSAKPVESVPKAVTATEAAVSAMEVAQEIAEADRRQQNQYCFPPIDLLNVSGRSSTDGTAEMRENSRRLNETLASFKIDAHIVNVTRGPSVTRYEVALEKGVRLNKLTTCADDIALSLGASGVRIAAVPGKISVVGIEVPNKNVTTVSLREVVDSQEFNKSQSKSTFAVGKDIGGNCIVGNIAKMPHMLIAGTTGSGKSVCMNSISLSLLYKSSPEDVKLIMVDPKMVELGIYNGIPHLLIPVVTDPKKAAGSLQWAVTEMMRRYKIMSDAGVRDLESYNSIALSEEDGKKLPSVVIIIDELADLMLVAAKEVEDSICRIAQMGRAAGMHLIIAPQRPSADVITGLMKANIPSRIAFAVASAMESRIILDTQGAEKLVGKGDMLYAPIGNGKPLRVQGCFVTDGEVEAVASYVKANYSAEYNQQVLEDIEKKAQQTGKKAASASDPEPCAEEMDGDEMLPAAVDVILETGQASVSMLQRRLKLGYARAARIVDEMEEKGYVGPFQGSKPRAILITKEQWEMQRSNGNQQMAFSDLTDDYPIVSEDY